MKDQLKRDEPEKRKSNKKRKRSDCMSWTSPVSVDDLDSFLEGTEGGFLSLEEIDAKDYDFIQKGNRELPVSKERKGERDRSENEVKEVLLKDSTVKVNKKKKKKKKKDKRKIRNQLDKLKKDEGVNDEVSNKSSELVGTEDHPVKLSVDDDKFLGWRELRLHPLLEKAIQDLGFHEPTPIQKCCIPAGAHQGKDVIGAAETGSGKTLAFGLPILQRLLEEQEKEARKEGLKDSNEKTGHGKHVATPLRALIVAPTRELALQVCDHLKAVSKYTNIKVVPIVGGIAPQKQERLLNQQPHIVVGTPGRLWELMGNNERHLIELHSLSFFVLDEADRMIQKGHFHELQSIIGMLPLDNVSTNATLEQNHKRKKRQTFVFSATIALSSHFRKKLKRTSHVLKRGNNASFDSLEKLCERAGLRENAAVFDLTSESIVAHKLEESVIECREEDKDAYLYYILNVHGCGRTIVFCTSIAAVRRISAILRILKVLAWPLHAQMQQRARLKTMDRFRQHEDSVLVATDVAARGLDIPGVRTVIHYQLPHSAEIYVHRSGRTARASAEGCSVALVCPTDRSKYVSLCRVFSKDGHQAFPVNLGYMPDIEKRVSVARQIDQILCKNSKTQAKKNWYKRNAEALEIDLEANESDEENVKISRLEKAERSRARQLQKELDQMLSRPLQPKSLSHRFVAGAGMSTLLQQQLQQFTNSWGSDSRSSGEKKRKLLLIGQEAIEPLAALKDSKHAS